MQWIGAGRGNTLFSVWVCVYTCVRAGHRASLPVDTYIFVCAWSVCVSEITRALPNLLFYSPIIIFRKCPYFDVGTLPQKKPSIQIWVEKLSKR